MSSISKEIYTKFKIIGIRKLLLSFIILISSVSTFLYSLKNITPTNVSVTGYYRKDGTYVRGYNRRPSGSVNHDFPYEIIRNISLIAGFASCINLLLMKSDYKKINLIDFIYDSTNWSNNIPKEPKKPHVPKNSAVSKKEWKCDCCKNLIKKSEKYYYYKEVYFQGREHVCKKCYNKIIKSYFKYTAENTEFIQKLTNILKFKNNYLKEKYYFVFGVVLENKYDYLIDKLKKENKISYESIKIIEQVLAKDFWKDFEEYEKIQENFSNMKDCFKVLDLNNGDIYIGQTKNNIINGLGKYVCSNGDEYKGSFKLGKKDGPGYYKTVEGYIYIGNFSENQKHGKGFEKSINMAKYIGEFYNNQKHGYGRLFLENGDIYEGEFRNNQKHGYGVYSWKEGTKYIGEFYEEKMTGVGGVFSKNGKFEEGYMENGILIQASIKL